MAVARTTAARIFPFFLQRQRFEFDNDKDNVLIDRFNNILVVAFVSALLLNAVYFGLGGGVLGPRCCLGNVLRDLLWHFPRCYNGSARVWLWCLRLHCGQTINEMCAVKSYGGGDCVVAAVESTEADMTFCLGAMTAGRVIIGGSVSRMTLLLVLNMMHT